MKTERFINSAKSILWREVNQDSSESNTPPLFIHYTSIHALEQIITKEEFWFSNPLLMNDLEEFKFGMTEGERLLNCSEEIRRACRTPENHKKLLQCFYDLNDKFNTIHLLNTYVMCFSEHTQNDDDGLLSMWRGYGNSGSGAALVIDSAKIKPTQSTPFIIDKVHYGSKEKRKDWINNKLLSLAKVIETHATEECDFIDAAKELFSRLICFALFTKHHGFREEKEWRIVYFNDRDCNNSFKKYFGHMATKRGIEPKLKLPINAISELNSENISLGQLVKKIILGPTTCPLAVGSMCQMLEKIGQLDLVNKVVLSEIPFRTP
jgi:hypothetical protein